MIIKALLHVTLVVLIVSAYVFGPEPANAQTSENLLGGVKKATVIVRTMFDSKQCNIGESDVKAAFVKPFDGYDIKITDRSIDVAIEIMVKSVAPMSKSGKVLACVSIVDLSAWAQTGYRKLRFNRSSTITKAVLYSETTKVVSGVREHPANVNRIVGEMAARFIKNHAMDN